MTAGRVPRIVLPVVFFVAWAIAFTFPLVQHLGDSVILARGGDAWLHIWDLWWANKALVQLHQSPYHTTMLYYPTGLNLYYHSLDIVNGVVSIPLQFVVGLTPAFNLLVLTTLTLDGLVAYWLCLDRTKSVGASIVGGALFASAPLLGTSVNLGQLDEVTVWWIPLYLLALWRALDSPGPVWTRAGGRRAVLAAGVCVIGASLATWYFTAGLLVFTVLFIAGYVISSGGGLKALAWWHAGSRALLAWLIFVLGLSPLLWAMVRERLSGETYMLPAAGTTIFNSIDIAALFLPPRVEAPSINGHGGNVSLGYVALALSLYAMVRGWRTLWPWGLALLGVLIMSLGPDLLVLGQDTGVPMPYALLNSVPFIGASRQPLRFLATAEMALALLSAFGVTYLIGWLRPARDGQVEETRSGPARLQTAVVAGTLALTVAELFGLPRALASTRVDQAYAFLRDSAGEGAVMEVPVDKWSAPALLNQTVHEKPIVGGYTSRHFPYPLAQLPVPGISELFDGDPAPLTAHDILSPTVSQTALGALDHFNVRYVVAHKPDLADPHYQGLAAVIQALYNAPNASYDDAQVAVYQTPSVGLTTPLVGLGDGWYGPETAGGPLHRWTNGQASLWVLVPSPSGAHYKLTLTAYSYRVTRTLVVSVDGRQIAREKVGPAFGSFDFDLGPLSAQEHTVTLQSAEPPEMPPGDSREISLGFTQVSIQQTK